MAFNNVTSGAGAAGRLEQTRKILSNKQEAIFGGEAESVALESMTGSSVSLNTKATAENQFTAVCTALADNYGEAGAEVSPALESAARTAMLLADTKNYFNKVKGLHTGSIKPQGEEVFGIGRGYASLQSADNVALERFNPQGFNEFRAESIEFNYRSAIASAATELMYPTVQVGAEFAGITVDLNRSVIQANLDNPMNGETFDQGLRNVLDGLRDSDFLKSDANKLIPVPSAETERFFADKTVYEPKEIQVKQKTKLTAPLGLFGEEFNLLGLCTTSGRMDESGYKSDDMVDRGLAVAGVHLKVGDAAAQNFRVDLSMHHAATFLAGAQTSSDSITNLQFFADNIVVDIAGLKNYKGVALTAFEALITAGVARLVLKADINGRFNHRTNDIMVSVPTWSVVSYLDEAGKEVAVAAEEKVTLTAAAIEFDGTLSNANYRQVGTLVETQSRQITFAMRVSPAISCRRPQDTSNVDAEIKAMAEAKIVRTDGDAIDFTLQSIDHLDRACRAGVNNLTPTQLQTPGAFYVTPWVRKETIDIANLVNTEISSLKESDLSAALVSLLSDTASVAATESNLLAVTRAGKGQPDAKIKWGIVTTDQLAKFLTVRGDERTFGGNEANFEAKPTIATTVNAKWDGHIFLFPIDDNGGSYSPWSWGTRFAQPTLLSECNMGDGGSQIKLLQTLPVERMVVDMPVGYLVKVTGVSEWIKERQAALRETTGGGAGAGTMDVNLVGVQTTDVLKTDQQGDITIDTTTPLNTTVV